MNYPLTAFLLLPELTLVVAALAVIGLGVASGRGGAGLRKTLWIVALAGLVAAGAFVLALPARAAIEGGMLEITPTGRLLKILLLAMGAFTLALTTGHPRREHTGEYLGLILLSITGMLLVIGSSDLLMMFVALELAGLPLYILSGFDRSSARAAEAAVKYFLFGAAATAFLLFGLSIFYGYAHTTRIEGLAASLAGQPLEPMLAVGIIMVLAGLGFKAATVPFHFWAPDTYQCAPLPSAALIASASKVAVFFILAKLLVVGLAGFEGAGAWGGMAPGWVPLLLVLAVLSMAHGNLAALAQRSSVRRLLAYSAIAHGGYILLGLCAASPEGTRAALFMAVVYGFTAIGAFAVVGIVENARGSDKPAAFNGLFRDMPATAVCLLVFLMSLAGIPPLAGFFAKFSIFLAALESGNAAAPGLLWAVALGVGLNAVSLYYYLLVLKHAFVLPAPDDSPSGTRPDLPVQISVFALAAIVLLLGLFPGWLFAALG
jgi:NADH-quinone oxidoreductase subunit N